MQTIRPAGLSEECFLRVYFHMNRITSKMREFAERLIAFEAPENSSKMKVLPALVVCEKLRPHLSTLMGNAGFRALLVRALALANSEVPWLQAVKVNADGSLEGLDQPAPQTPPEEITEGRVVLIAQFLGLLEAFIGESLTVRLLREVWPKLPLSDLPTGK
jgi:hypothetical protein